MPSTLLQVVNSSFQTCYNKPRTSRTNKSCWQLVNRLVSICLQTCNNLCVFTRVEVNVRENMRVTIVGCFTSIVIALPLFPWIFVTNIYSYSSCIKVNWTRPPPQSFCRYLLKFVTFSKKHFPNYIAKWLEND